MTLPSLGRGSKRGFASVPRKGVVHDAATFLTRHDLSGDPN